MFILSSYSLHTLPLLELSKACIKKACMSQYMHFTQLNLTMYIISNDIILNMLLFLSNILNHGVTMSLHCVPCFHQSLKSVHVWVKSDCNNFPFKFEHADFSISMEVVTKPLFPLSQLCSLWSLYQVPIFTPLFSSSSLSRACMSESSACSN